LKKEPSYLKKEPSYFEQEIKKGQNECVEKQLVPQ